MSDEEADLRARLAGLNITLELFDEGMGWSNIDELLNRKVEENYIQLMRASSMEEVCTIRGRIEILTWMQRLPAIIYTEQQIVREKLMRLEEATDA